jgi:rubrerythrin
MIKHEILIGRQVEKGNYVIEQKYGSISRVHAKITKKPDGIYLEDLDSANGTWVNGRRIKSKKVSSSDIIMLGGLGYYKLELSNVLRLMPISDDEFSFRMRSLKNIYEEYISESTHMQSKMQEDMMTKRMLPTMLLGVFTTLAAIFVGDDTQTKTIIAVTGALLSVLVFIIATKWASKSSIGMKDRLNKLNEKFEIDYVCPGCGAPFKGKSWEFINRWGKCPACKREFHI